MLGHRSKIEQDFNFKFYFYKERNIEGCDGLTYFTIRTIVIEKDLNEYQYCKTFAHEVLHLKLFIQQEDFICYETFKYLYESEELHNVGVWYGLQQLRGCYSGKYNISGHVVNYLTNKWKFDILKVWIIFDNFWCQNFNVVADTLNDC